MEVLGVPGVTRTAEPGLWDRLSGPVLAREGSCVLMEEMCVVCEGVAFVGTSELLCCEQVVSPIGKMMLISAWGIGGKAMLA